MKKTVKILKLLLYPNTKALVPLLVISAALTAYTSVKFGAKSIAAAVSYATSFYTLVVWCIRIPEIIRFFASFKSNNKYAKIYFSDPRVRVIISLYGTFVWNTAYALMHLVLGLRHKSFWFLSLSVYYILLAVMRFFLACHSRKYKPGQRMYKELVKYRMCAVVFLFLNVILSAVVFFMVYWNRTFNHHQITAIAMAAYTFTSFTAATVNIVRYRKYNSPVFSASKAISLANACVSMLTLESTMLTAFGGETLTDKTRLVFLSLSGGAVSVFLIVTAVYMIVNSNRKIRLIKNQRRRPNNGE